MSFNKKTWVNRVVQYPLRRLLTIVRPFDTTNTAVMDIQREDGEVTTEGDAFTASNMNDLESRIETAFEDVIPKVTTMPTPSVDNVGTQVTYVGATDSTYTKGYTYECQSNNNVYSWVHIGATEITVDSALSSTSTNPLQNKKVFSSLQKILGNLATYHVGNKATSAVTSGSYVVYGNPDNPHFAVANTAISRRTTFDSGTGGNVTNKKVADVLTTLNNDLTPLDVSSNFVKNTSVIHAANVFAYKVGKIVIVSAFILIKAGFTSLQTQKLFDLTDLVPKSNAYVPITIVMDYLGGTNNMTQELFVDRTQRIIRFPTEGGHQLPSTSTTNTAIYCSFAFVIE